ncbi:DMT family transporter [Sandarakinorhabdus sp. DWP1-3-1]|uniref:DMT family transporter n=1 Tax=Sandarakinorhabdus sp. DWP1-3-1 TaxID=2804627 RepID=UPI003CF6A49B
MSRPVAFTQYAAGVGALCVMDAMVKYLTADHSVPVVTLGRYVTGTIIALAVWQAQGRPALTRAMLPVHLLRGVLLATMALTFYWSLTRLPLAESITLSFIAPLLVPVFASLMLGERMQPRYVAAGALGFIGVLVTAQGAPSFSGDRLLGLAAVLYAAVAYAASSVLLRARAAADGSTVVTLMGAAVPMLLLSPVAIGAPAPDLSAILWFIGLGLVGNIGVQLIAKAYARLEAQALAVVEFSALPWAALFGWLFFQEPVRSQVWTGAAIILAACVWASRPERTAATAS